MEILHTTGKCIVGAYAVIFAGLGMVLFGAGTFVMYQLDSYNGFLVDDHGLLLPAVLLMAAGAAVFLVSCCGLWGVLRSSPCLVLVFALMLLSLLILQCFGAVYALKYRGSSWGGLEERMRELQSQYPVPDPKFDPARLSWDSLQQELQCCGVLSPTEWTDRLHVAIPASCRCGGSDPLLTEQPLLGMGPVLLEARQAGHFSTTRFRPRSFSTPPHAVTLRGKVRPSSSAPISPHKNPMLHSKTRAFTPPTTVSTSPKPETKMDVTPTKSDKTQEVTPANVAHSTSPKPEPRMDVTPIKSDSGTQEVKPANVAHSTTPKQEPRVDVTSLKTENKTRGVTPLNVIVHSTTPKPRQSVEPQSDLTESEEERLLGVDSAVFPDIEPTMDDAARGTCSNGVYATGCLPELRGQLQDGLLTLAIISVSLIILQVIGLVVAVLIARSLRRRGYVQLV